LDKKTLPIIILLVLAVVFYWQILEFLGLVEPSPESAQTFPADTTIQVTKPPESSVQQSDQTLRSTTEPQATVAVSLPEDSAQADSIIVQTGKYTALLSSKGGGLLSIILSDYTYRDGEPIEMIPDASVATPNAEFADGSFEASSLFYTCNLQPGTYNVSGESLELTYSYLSSQGGEIIKTYKFYPDDYHIDLQLQVNGTQSFGFERSYSLVWNSPLGVTEPNLEIDYEAMEAVAMQSGSRVKLDDFDNGLLDQSEEGDAAWVGVRSKYFAAVMIPQDREAAAVFARGSKDNISTPDGKIERRQITAGMKMQLGAAGSINDRCRIFVGPLDYTLMSKYEVGLEDMLDIGTTPVVGWLIKPFAVAIIWVLPKMYSVLPNYGVVIILFALLVKIVTLPLSMKSFKSMNAMKELQPKIEQLKEKHKKNPQALNKEMMGMYKKHGVNPMSGCLPMLPQMPLFFALFSVFRSTILLRDAPFVWFINDLSRGAASFTDPYIILVILMIATQFVSQSLTMATTQQNKMFMYIMPLFMGFIFYKFAAGLVLYWTCFSLFSLIDYFLFKRKKNTQVKAA